MMQKHSLIMLCAASLLLTACTSVTIPEGQPLPPINADETASSIGLSHLSSAAAKDSLQCHSTMPLTNGTSFNSLYFDCPRKSVRATVAQIRQHGWSIETVDIGKEERKGNDVAIPISITIRKLH